MADAESRIVRAARIEHALEMLLEPRRPAAVRKELRRKYGVSEAASRNYVNAAYELGGRELVKSLNTLRMESSVGSDEVADRIRGLAEGAEEAEQFVAAAMAWRAYEANRARKDRLWHLDKISPMLGLESRETRAQLVEALRDSAHLLTEAQRQELRDALSEVDDGDESVTTTLEAR
jgi:hypothetical protein